MNFENHPCFSPSAHGKFGRVHLPVAPRCNIQCKFCNRKFDCVNESRPGVTSGILTPHQAMAYLEEVFNLKKNISVMGIAGPGDPFANPDETMETLRLVREKYPEMILCVATNGLAIAPHLDELAKLAVSHVTVTVNAVDPAVGEKVYSWVRHGKRVLQARAGAELLLENQLAAIRGLKERGITVKVNSIIIPGINEDHIQAVAEKMSSLDVDLMNCIPYCKAPGSTLEHLEEPPKALVQKIQAKAEALIPQMRHCTRCRADAVGLLGEKPDQNLMTILQACQQSPCAVPPPKVLSPRRQNVAVATLEGIFINQHLGEAYRLLVYGEKDGTIQLLGERPAPEPGGGNLRWEQIALAISDCHTLLVSGVGEMPKSILADSGVETLVVEGLIDEAVTAVLTGGSLRHMIKRTLKACSGGQGRGGGCG